MEVIKNIINFNSEELEKRYDAAETEFETHPMCVKLNRKEKTCNVTMYACLAIEVIVLIGTIALRFALPAHFDVIRISVAIIMATTICLAFGAKCSYENVIRKWNANFDAFWAAKPDLDFFAVVDQRKILACFGEPVNNQNFKVTVIVEGNDDDKKSDFVLEAQ